MKDKILFCGYRDWAIDIFCELQEALGSEIDFSLANTTAKFEGKISQEQFNAILFIGWSWMVNEEVVNSNECICLHPSPLPKYRGGSPIQHQILNGEQESAVSLFLMDEQMDHGPVLWQSNFDLSGDLSNIFERISNLGTKGLIEILERNKKEKGFTWGLPQDHGAATTYRRRSPSESEIKLSDLVNRSAKDICDKIRALQDPYPNAYIACSGGSKLYLTKANYEND